ncbi:hypothetical protein FRB99_002261 [Tulasnella sp. 403]|nr:hypothetical protein FRB99_002261 [Tulasnella sp. 403]
MEDELVFIASDPSHFRITIPAFGRTVAQLVSYGDNTPMSLNIVSMENMPNLPPGTALGLQQALVEGNSGPRFQVKPVPQTDGPVGPSGDAYQSNVWNAPFGFGNITFGDYTRVYLLMWYNADYEWPEFRDNAYTFAGWVPMYMEFASTAGPAPPPPPPPPPAVGADGTFFTDASSLLQFGDQNELVWYPPTDTTYGSLEFAPIATRGQFLGFDQILNFEFGQWNPSIVAGGDQAAVTLDRVVKTFGDEAYYSRPPDDNLDWVHGSRVWSLDEATGKLTAHWKFASPDFFTTDTFWIWPPGQSDPFVLDQAVITNSEVVVINENEKRIPVNLYFFPDPSIDFVPDTSMY